MLELVFQYLIPCTHVMLSQRKRIKDIDTSCKSTQKFLSLSPSCCVSRPPTEYSSLTITPPHRRTNSISSDFSPGSPRRTDSLQGNYCAYLSDARKKVKACTLACCKWNYPYDGDNPEQAKKSDKSGPFSVDSNRNLTNKNAEQSLPSLGESSGYESFACREESRESSLEVEDSKCEHSPSLGTKDSGTSFEQQSDGSNQTSFSPPRTVPPKDSSSYMDMFHAAPDIGKLIDVDVCQGLGGYI